MMMTTIASKPTSGFFKHFAYSPISDFVAWFLFVFSNVSIKDIRCWISNMEFYEGVLLYCSGCCQILWLRSLIFLTEPSKVLALKTRHVPLCLATVRCKNHLKSWTNTTVYSLLPVNTSLHRILKPDSDLDSSLYYFDFGELFTMVSLLLNDRASVQGTNGKFRFKISSRSEN